MIRCFNYLFCSYKATCCFFPHITALGIAVGETREIKVLSKGAGPPPGPRAVPGCKTQSKVTPAAPLGPGAPGISATTSSTGRPGDAPLLASAESKVFITAPNGQTAELPTAPIADGVSSKFCLDEPGQYTLHVTHGGEEVPQTPFKFDVVSSVDEGITPQKAPAAAASAPGAGGPGAVKAYGPGLKGGMPQKPATFTVDTREAGLGELGLTIEGPAESQIDYKDNGDGTCDVTYIPPVLGDYTINVMYNDEHIKDSPFIAKVTPTPGLDVSGVTVSGPGIEPDGNVTLHVTLESWNMIENTHNCWLTLIMCLVTTNPFETPRFPPHHGLMLA